MKEIDPAILAELRAALTEMGRVGMPHLTGVLYQESRLPSVDGPEDCFDCHVVMCAQVPVAWQRIFEDGLRATGLTPEAVWGMREYRPPDSLIGTGRGWVSISRSSHSEHAEEYREGKARQGRPKDSGDGP